MAINIASIVTAYSALGTLVSATITAQAAIVALGARPTLPEIVNANADYNTPSAAQVTYDAALLAANTTFNTAVAAQKVQEAVVTALMPQNIWIHLTGLSNWTASAQWIGCPLPNNKLSPNANGVALASANLYTILASVTLPNNLFPQF